MRKKNKKAFTVVEMVMVMIILAIIAGIGLFSLVRFYELWLFSNYKMEVLWASRNLMRDLSMNVRMVRDKTSVYIANSSRFQFYNLGAAGTTDYQYANNRVYKNGVQLAAGVSSFAFTYYSCDKLGACAQIVAPVVSPGSTNINTIKIDFTVANPQQNVSTETSVNLRNLN